MSEKNLFNMPYEVPTYELPHDEAWFHFLHGNVPGHQIDYIYRPIVPQGALTRQHFSHLSRIVKYIEPRHGNAYAFAIANLSRDDTQYEPGHGAIALIFGLRINGPKDHAGRENPPFCHSAALVNRHVDGAALYTSAIQFYQKLLPDEESRVEGSGWYHTYVEYAQNPDGLPRLLRGYVGDFSGLYAPGPSRLSLRFTVEASTPPRRVVIVYPDNADFTMLAYCMARIANVLVESDIKWTAISNGREQDVAGGVTVRFVPRREATVEPADVVVFNLEQVPEKPADIAAQLFHAREVENSWVQDRPMHLRYSEAPLPVEEFVPATEGPSSAPGLILPQLDRASELKQRQRKQQFTTLLGLGVLIAALGVLAAVWIGSAPMEETPQTNAAPVIVTSPPVATSAPPAASSVPVAIVEDAAPTVQEHPTKAVTKTPTAKTAKNKPAPMKKTPPKTGKSKPGKNPWNGGLDLNSKSRGH